MPPAPVDPPDTITPAEAADQPGRGVCVFSPGVHLSVTIEVGLRGEEIHLHPGGQGYWLARSIERLGEPVVFCATVGGEVGDVLTPLLQSQTRIEVVPVHQAAPSAVSVYDRRSGSRTVIARSEAGPIDRHSVDKLYSLTLAHAIGRGCCVLAGNVDTGVIPPTYYGRLCADLAAVGVPLIVDLHGPELDEILDCATVRMIKVSDEDLLEDDVARGDQARGLVGAVNDLAERGPHDLVVSRGPDRPGVARLAGRWFTFSTPRLAAVDWRGAGDAMTGAMAVAHVRGHSGPEVVRFGAAAGTASTTRRGLASVDAELVDALVPRVRVEPAESAADALDA